METLRNDIKILADGQSALRNQRRTINLVGERTVTPGRAASQHLENRHTLRLLYATQGLLKGRTLAEIEPNNSSETTPLSYYQLRLDKLVAQYATPVRID